MRSPTRLSYPRPFLMAYMSVNLAHSSTGEPFNTSWQSGGSGRTTLESCPCTRYHACNMKAGSLAMLYSDVIVLHQYRTKLANYNIAVARLPRGKTHSWYVRSDLKLLHANQLSLVIDLFQNSRMIFRHTYLALQCCKQHVLIALRQQYRS